MSRGERPNRLNEKLKELLALAEREEISLKTLIHFLEGKGQATLLILIALPFCLPIQIPGLAIPFGLLLAFIGLRIAFGHRIWIPEKILQRKISHDLLEKVAHYALKITNYFRKFSFTRWIWLVQNPILHIFHGLTIALLALLLSLPIPLPFTNIIVAVPIVIFGLALLDDDGVLLCVAYAFAFLAFIVFAMLFTLGAEGANHLFANTF